jgi:hypothetical protein
MDAPMALSGCERVEGAATGARTGARKFTVAMSNVFARKNVQPVKWTHTHTCTVTKNGASEG